MVEQLLTAVASNAGLTVALLLARSCGEGGRQNGPCSSHIGRDRELGAHFSDATGGRNLNLCHRGVEQVFSTFGCIHSSIRNTWQ